MHTVELREMVTSPGGTTIQAIRELERAGSGGVSERHSGRHGGGRELAAEQS